MIIIIIPIIFTFLIIYIILELSYYYDAKWYPRISFKQFKSLYSIAPDKWLIREGPYGIYDDGDRIYFKSMLDCLRVLLLKHRQDILSTKKYNNKCLLKLTVQWQRDINDYHEKIESELRNIKEKDK